MPDPELAMALKQAYVRKMFFAFIPKGTDGKLIVSRKRFHPKEIEGAKKGIGGGTAVMGTLFGPMTGMVFQVDKMPSVKLSDTLQKVVKRDTGLHIVAEVQMAPLAPVEEH